MRRPCWTREAKAAKVLAEKRAEALRLRLEGATYREITDRLGWANQSSAYAAMMKELHEITREPAEAVRDMELDRLNTMTSNSPPSG